MSFVLFHPFLCLSILRVSETSFDRFNSLYQASMVSLVVDEHVVAVLLFYFCLNALEFLQSHLKPRLGFSMAGDVELQTSS